MAELTSVMQKFILHWGEMGSTWGINRTVAQIYALLYLSPAPLTAEEISETLTVARSTVSTGLRELQGWGIVKTVPVLGDRRDHFEAVSDVWGLFRAIVDERKRRELDPTLEMLREAAAGLGASEEDLYVREKLLEMLDSFETVTALYEQFQGLPTDVLVKIVKKGDAIRKLLSLSSNS